MLVSAATFRIDLVTVKVAGKVSPQFATSLDTQASPSATFSLTRPVMLTSAVDSGATTKGTATGQLTMNGTSQTVTFTTSYRRSGAALQFAGLDPHRLLRLGIGQPQG